MRKSVCAWATVVVSFVFTASTAHGRSPNELVATYRPLPPVVKPAEIRISPNAGPGDIVVKFRRGLPVESATTRLGGPAASRVRQVFRDYQIPEPLPSIPGDPSAIRTRRMADEDRVQMNLPDLSLYFHASVIDPALAETVIRELNALDEVEIAYFQPRPEVAAFKGASTAPNFEGGQTYLDQAPSGVSARAAWSLPGGAGNGIRIFDVEYGWQLTHEDLSKGATAIVISGNSSDNDHGTAVMGEMVSDLNGFGMSGIAHDAQIGTSSVSTQSVEGAIQAATLAASPGDLILIELHSPGPHYDGQVRDDQLGYVAMEYFQAVFDAILNAYAHGVIVCEAAGNGAENFDDASLYGSLFDTTFRNSHAIICGAGYPPYPGNPDRYRLGFSNYGARVNLQGYGISVYSTGYGDLYNGGSKDSWYTSGFSGTSSASPIVTGSVACLSGVFKQMLGATIDADSVRSLLVATGSPQPTSNQAWHIGPRPDLHAALGSFVSATDSIWYGHIDLPVGSEVAFPVSLSNASPVREIYLPFKLTGPATIFIDSLTRGPRTSGFDIVQTLFDNRFNGEMGYLMKADAVGDAPSLSAGSGVVANLWVRAAYDDIPGQAKAVDSAWLGQSTRLRLVSFFDDKSPDYFSAGSVTITPSLCDCSHHGDINGDLVFDVLDIVAMIDITFQGGTPAPTDPICPHATRADDNCDGIVDVLDVVYAIELVFQGGAPPCNPCG